MTYGVLFVSIQRRWEKREIHQNFGGENSCKAFTRMMIQKMRVIKWTTRRIHGSDNPLISVTAGYIFNISR